MDNQTYYIYALQDPITQDTRYIGRTTNLKLRYNFHRVANRGYKATALNDWLRELKANGLPPRLIVLQVLPDSTERAAGEIEARWINTYLERGHKLLNAGVPSQRLAMDVVLSALNTFTDQQIMEVKAYVDSRMGHALLTQFTSTQPIADQIKALISREGRRATRILPLVADLERAAWYPTAFEDAANQSGFQYSGALNYAGDDMIAAAERLIKTYLEIVAKG